MSKVILFLLFISISLVAKSTYELGKSTYNEKGCGGCHGTRLEGMNTYPYLANRSKGYLGFKLKRFRSRVSDNQQQELMIPFAMSLSDEEIENLTTYMYEYVEEENTKKYDDSFEVYGDGGS